MGRIIDDNADMTRRNHLLIFYALLMCICHVLPVIKYSLPYVVLSTIMLITYFFYVGTYGGIEQKPFGTVIGCSIILAFLMFVVCNPLNITESINEFVRNMRMVSPAFLFIALNDRRCIKGKKIIYIALLVMCLFITFKTIAELETNTALARQLAYGSGISDEIAAYRYKNVGGFEFCYSMGFMAVFLLGCITHTNNNKSRLLILAIVAIFVVLIVKAQYMTLLLLTLMFTAIMLYQNSKRTKWMLLCLLLFIVFLALLPEILQQLQSNSKLSMLSYKIGLFEQFFEYGDINVLGSRPRRLLEGLRYFIESPIWGNRVYENGIAISGMQEEHSTLVGYLEHMGLIGFFALYSTINAVTKAVLNRFENPVSIKLFKLIMKFWFVLSILNPIHNCYEIYICIFLIIPCMISVMFEGKDSQNAEFEQLEN